MKDLTNAEKQLVADALIFAAQRIEDTWGQAYPEDIFPTLKLGDGAATDGERSRISGAMGRHVVKHIVRDLKTMSASIRQGEL